MAETPRSLTHLGVFSNTDSSGGASYSNKDAGVSVDRPATIKVYLGDPDCSFVFYPATLRISANYDSVKFILDFLMMLF